MRRRPIALIVCGGRDFGDEVLLWEALDRHATLIHGDAPGADRIAGRWAAARGVPTRAMRADWETHGRSAGPRRNGEMPAALLAEPAPRAVLAAPGGRGTADMVSRARRAGVKCVELKGGER